MTDAPDENPPPATGPRAAGAPDRAVRDLAGALDRTRARVRTLLIARASATLLAASIFAVVALGLIDLGLRLPAMVRAVLLLAGLAALVHAARRFLLPAFRWHISHAAMAQRLERLFPEHAGAIAPAVDLLAQSDTPGEPGAIARAGIARASDHVRRVRAPALIRYSGLNRAAGAFAAAVAVILTLAILSPAMTGIGARRVLAPWTDARWPTRFGVTDLTQTQIHPIDEALPVRVAVGPGDPRAGVRIEWVDSADATLQRAPMTAQPAGDDGQRNYERLIDPAGAGVDADAQRTLRYRVVTPDDRSGWTTVRLVRPPEVVAASATITPPNHAVDAPGLANFRTGVIDLQTGDAVLGPLLGGSDIEITWAFSSDITPVEPDAWSSAAITVAQLDPRRIRVTVPSDAPARVAPAVEDQYGLGVRLPVSVGIDTRPDSVPSVQIASPASDQVVTPDAVIQARIESVDEVGVTSLRLEAQRLAKPDGSPGAPPEPIGSPAPVRSTPADAPVLTRVELDASVSPGALDARPGDELVLVAIAADTRGVEGTVRSQPRRLRVVSQEDFAARLRAQLDPISGLLRRGDDQQRELIERNASPDRDPGPIAREQMSLGDSIASARRAVRELDRAAEANRVEDGALTSMLEDLDETLTEGTNAARRAASLTEQDQPRDAADAQQEVRERLGEAISMLDRGSDAYLARRAISRLREQLEQARADTADVGQRTAGQRDDEISRSDRDELDRLAQAQQDLADRAREALEELERRAEALETDDPAQAEALRRAAESGRASDVASQIQQGGEQTGQNQTGQAQQSQQEALEQLDEMLEQIDSAAGLRDTALRRKLADLMQSIGALIRSQERELDRLAAARASGESRALPQGMIALRNNTLGVIDDASAALAELRLIAEALRDAQDAQTDAITALRLDTPDLDSAEGSEQQSLQLLEQALEEAKRQDDQAEQREQERRKAELRKAYREALEAQAAIRDDSAPLLGRALNRRQRIESRRVSTAQRELARTVETIRESTEELAEAPVFGLAHDQLDLLMRAAADGLAESSPPGSVALDQENAAALLASLVDVLSDRNQPNQDDFQEGSGGEGGGGSGEGDQPLIPPVAELRLLRDMQGAAMVMTRRMGENPDLRADADRVRRLADLQGALAERGTALIERLNQQPGQPVPPESGPVQSDEPEEPAEPPAESSTDSDAGSPAESDDGDS